MLYLLYVLWPVLGYQQIPLYEKPPVPKEDLVLNEVIVRFRFEDGTRKNGMLTSQALHEAARSVATANGLPQLDGSAIRPLHRDLHETMERTGQTEAVLLSKRFTRKNKRLAKTFDPSKYGLAQSFVIKVPGDPETWAKRFKENATSLVKGIVVTDATPNFLHTTSADSRYQEQWYMKNNGQTGGVIGADINIEEAWNQSRGSGVVIAIIDSGVDFTHPDLEANMWTNEGEIPDNGIDDDENGFVDDVRGWDFIDVTNGCADDEDCDTPDNNPMDLHGHGTHCAGVAAAAENGNGIIGVAPEARIMPLRAGYKSASGNGLLPDDAILSAVAYAAANGADIVSMSFSSSRERELPPEFQLAVDAGLILVAAAGNLGEGHSSYPAAHVETISVGATDDHDGTAYFSNFGHAVDVMAPGVNILSTEPGNRYDSRSGTSMSCPMVAGAVALLIQQKPELTASQVKHLLRNQADDLAAPGWDWITGYGRLNVANLLKGPVPPSGYVEIDRFQMDYENSYRVSHSYAGEMDITGIIEADSEARFTLSYYHPENANWVTLCTGNGPRGNTICEDVFFSEVPEGRQIVELRVEQNGQPTKRTYLYAWVDNLLTSLSDGDTLNQGGTRQGLFETFFDYDEVTMLFRRSGDTQWQSNAFQLEPGDRGLEFTWDNVGLDPNATYEIRLGFKRGTREFSHTFVDLKLDSQFKGGWPRTFFSRIVDQQVRDSPGYVVPTVYDIDGDGYKEVITYHQSGGSNLSVFDHEGNLKWSRTPMKGLIPRGFQPTPVVVDLNGKGQTAIIITHLKELFSGHVPDPGLVYMYDAEGNLYPGFPVGLEFSNFFSVTAADFDQDGIKEIVAVGQSGLIVFGHDGSKKHEWSIDKSVPYLNPAVGNFDDDPELEIVYNDIDYEKGMLIRIADIDGTPLPGWPDDIRGDIDTDLHVVDMDGDGKEDLVALTDNLGQELQVRNRNGDFLPGWPKALPSPGFLSVADADGDGHPEIFVRSSDGLYRFNHLGEVADGWPVNVSVTSRAALADLDGDGLAEVIVPDWGSHPTWGGRIRTFNLAGNELTLFTKDLPTVSPEFVDNIPVISDLDNDGQMEILLSYPNTGHEGVVHEEAVLNVWEMKGTNYNAIPYGAFLHDGGNTRRAATPLRDYAPFLLMPHTPSNNDWFTSTFLANPGPQQQAALLVDKNHEGTTRAMKEVYLSAGTGSWMENLSDLFPTSEGPTGQTQVCLGSNTGPVMSMVHIQARDLQQDIGLVFPADNRHAVVSLDHIPTADWWLGMVVHNGADEEIQLYWEGSDGLIKAFPQMINPTQPGTKTAFSLNDMVVPGQRPATARVLAYAAGSQIVDGEIVGEPVAAIENAYVLYGRQDQQWFSEGYMLPGEGDLSLNSNTLFLPLAEGAPFTDAKHFDGFTVKNHAEESGEIQVKHYGPSGNVVGEATFSLAAGEKYVFVPSDLGLDGSRGGYLRLENSAGKLMGLFLSGDFKTHLAGGRLLGANAASTKLMGAWQNTEKNGSWVTVMNTDAVEHVLEWVLLNEDGEEVAVIEEIIPAHGNLTFDWDVVPETVTAILVRGTEEAGLLGYRFRYGKETRTMSSTSLIPVE